jgi:hypothetical protein
MLIGSHHVEENDAVCPDGCRIDTCVTFLWLAIDLNQEV